MASIFLPHNCLLLKCATDVAFAGISALSFAAGRCDFSVVQCFGQLVFALFDLAWSLPFLRRRKKPLSFVRSDVVWTERFSDRKISARGVIWSYSCEFIPPQELSPEMLAARLR